MPSVANLRRSFGSQNGSEYLLGIKVSLTEIGFFEEIGFFTPLTAAESLVLWQVLQNAIANAQGRRIFFFRFPGLCTHRYT